MQIALNLYFIKAHAARRSAKDLRIQDIPVSLLDANATFKTKYSTMTPGQTTTESVTLH